MSGTQSSTSVSDYYCLHPAFLGFSTCDVDPAVYPYNLDDIYPASMSNLPTRVEGILGLHVELSAAYPNIFPCKPIYTIRLPVLTVSSLLSDPPVYPHFAVYSAVSSGSLSAIEIVLGGQEPSVSQYPYLVICEYISCTIAFLTRLIVHRRPSGLSMHGNLPRSMGAGRSPGKCSKATAEVHPYGASRAGFCSGHVHTSTCTFAEEAQVHTHGTASSGHRRSAGVDFRSHISTSSGPGPVAQACTPPTSGPFASQGDVARVHSEVSRKLQIGFSGAEADFACY